MPTVTPATATDKLSSHTIETVGIGNLKNDLILIILETDPAKKKALFQALDVPEHAYFADPVV